MKLHRGYASELLEHGTAAGVVGKKTRTEGMAGGGGGSSLPFMDVIAKANGVDRASSSSTTTSTHAEHEQPQQTTVVATQPSDDSHGSGPPDYLFMFDHLMKHEGGLSNDPGDSAAAHPCPATHAGQTGWHTNKGITWTTFQGSAATLGYDENDYDLFFEMPLSLVKRIFKSKYWDKVHGDEYHSQAVANIFTQWAWGSGVGGALTKVLQPLLPEIDSWAAAPAIINAMIATDGERAVFELLMNRRRDFLMSISEPGMKNAKYRDPWMRRHADFYKLNESTLQ